MFPEIRKCERAWPITVLFNAWVYHKKVYAYVKEGHLRRVQVENGRDRNKSTSGCRSDRVCLPYVLCLFSDSVLSLPFSFLSSHSVLYLSKSRFERVQEEDRKPDSN